MSDAELQQQQLHPWTRWSPPTSADSYSALFHSDVLADSKHCNIHILPAEHLCHKLNTETCHIWIRHLVPLSWYLPHHTSSKVNKHSGEKLVKTVLHQVCCILYFWHQEHLVLASSALLVLTSNGLLRALQGDYLCTISESLWSLRDNGILS